MDNVKVLITKEEIRNKVEELAARISAEYGDDELLLICNLKGAFIFLADLCRLIRSPIAIDFIAVTSYKGTKSTGAPRIVKDLKMSVEGKNVLLVEDIVDTGYTLDYIIKYLELHGPKSIKVCTLLDKRCMRQVDVQVDFIGFDLDDRFVVGYGLDYNERYREMECIAELLPGREHGE